MSFLLVDSLMNVRANGDLRIGNLAVLLDDPRYTSYRDTSIYKIYISYIEISRGQTAKNRRSFDFAQDFACGFRRPQNGSTQIPRLRSGLRLAARTPRKRLSFTKKGAHSVIPSGALISGQLGADGLLTDWFNPSVVLNGRKILRLRSGFRLRVAARLNPFDKLRVTPAKRLNTDPSTTLGTSARGSDAAKTPQLYKKQALIRKSVNALDFTGVRCLRICLRIDFNP